MVNTLRRYELQSKGQDFITPRVFSVVRGSLIMCFAVGGVFFVCLFLFVCFSRTLTTNLSFPVFRRTSHRPVHVLPPSQTNYL